MAGVMPAVPIAMTTVQTRPRESAWLSHREPGAQAPLGDAERLPLMGARSIACHVPAHTRGASELQWSPRRDRALSMSGVRPMRLTHGVRETVSLRGLPAAPLRHDKGWSSLSLRVTDQSVQAS